MSTAITETLSLDRWNLDEGDELAPGRTALRHVGGGRRYDAYLAWDEALHCVVVCKLVRPHLVHDERALAGLAREWRTLRRLAHPAIVRGFDAQLGGSRPHIVLEHLEGPRLSTLVRRYGPLSGEQLVPLGMQLCAALHYLRGAGVVHLDLKPSNVIMAGAPRLIDLSVAREDRELQSLVDTVGTDAYMAPEQCSPRELGPPGPAADVWGLGCTLYLAATGRMPFSHAPGERWPQLTREPEWPQRAPEAIAALIMLCLEPDPRRRPEPVLLHDGFEGLLEDLPKPRLARMRPRG